MSQMLDRELPWNNKRRVDTPVASSTRTVEIFIRDLE